MSMSSILFAGTEYPVRHLQIPDSSLREGKYSVCISTHELYAALAIDDTYLSEAAELVDGMFAGYVTKEELETCTNAELIDKLGYMP